VLRPDALLRLSPQSREAAVEVLAEGLAYSVRGESALSGVDLPLVRHWALRGINETTARAARLREHLSIHPNFFGGRTG
jgi:hypothetical protein